MSTKDERISNAWRALVGAPVQPVEVRWWHAYGRIRQFPRADGQPPDIAHQLTVIGPALAGPDSAREMAADSWGEYLTSWDHPPTDAEKEAVTPEEFRDEEEGLGSGSNTGS